MSICVSVKVSEGLVLVADSAAAIQGRTGDGQQGILKTFEHVRKSSHIKDYPIGTLNWGAALIGSRSVYSLIKEWEYDLPSLQEEEEKVKANLLQDSEADAHYRYTVKDRAQDLLNRIRKYYNAIYSDQQVRPFLGMLIGGFSAGSPHSEQWLFELPNRPELVEVRPDVNDQPDFGAHWFGITDAIVRLHFGRDDSALKIISQHFGVTTEEIVELLGPLQYAVPFAGMPLQDAIDYAVYLVNVVIGRFRFVVGAPLCGGEVDVAVVTPNNFTWVKRKDWKVGK